MQKWEYLRVEVVADRANFQLTNTINGQVTRYPYPQSLIPTSDTHLPVLEWYSRVLNQFGDEGWELVGLPRSTAEHGETYLFKRPK
jgi:hypothetical protein